MEVKSCISPDFGPDLRGLFKTGKYLAHFVFKGDIFHSVTNEMGVHLLNENLGWQRMSLGIWLGQHNCVPSYCRPSVVTMR